MQRQGRPLRAKEGGPSDRAQRNFTDPDSRIQPILDGFVQGYNAQAGVDAAGQIIVAQRLVAGPAGYPGLVPLVDQGRNRLGHRPREVSADEGFCNEANLAALQERRIGADIPPGRARHGEASTAGRRSLKAKPLAMVMAAKLRRAGHRTRYRLRKQTVEPGFGQIKHARDSGNSCSTVSTRSGANGRCSAPPIPSSSSPEPLQPEPQRMNAAIRLSISLVGQNAVTWTGT
jgi:Transposase DDE domain